MNRFTAWVADREATRLHAQADRIERQWVEDRGAVPPAVWVELDDLREEAARLRDRIGWEFE